jgi:flagellar basal body-associated protein FliL
MQMKNNWEIQGIDSIYFHSSREERQKLGGIEKKKKTGFFQNNPTFKIIIIDLIFIVIISGVIVPFIMKREGSARLDNFKVILKAFNYDDEVMATLTVRETENRKSDGVIDAGFYLKDNSEEMTESDLLPSFGNERVLKISLKSIESDYIFCNVQINGKNKTIKKRIQ